MNKSGKRKPVSKCRLVQMDISDSFNRWRSSQKMKQSEKKVCKFTSSLVIQIPDSDSEPESEGYIDYISSTNKRKLPFPFSHDDEEDENIAPSQKTGSENAIATPSKSVNIGVHQPNVQSTHPEACSTPVKSSESSIKNSHNFLDLSNISKIATKTYNDSGLVSDTDSERTLIYQKSPSPNKNVNIIEARINPTKIDKTNCSNNSSDGIRPVGKNINTHGSSQDNKGTSSPLTERVATEEILSKRQKVNPPDKEKKPFNRKLFNEKESVELSNNSIGKQNGSENYVISRPNYSNRPKEKNVYTNGKHEMERCDENVFKRHRVVERKNGTNEESNSKDNESVQSTKVNIADNLIIAIEKRGNKDEQAFSKTDVHPSSRSPSKSPSKGKVTETAKFETKTESKKINMKYVTLIQELFNTVYETNSVNNLLDDDRKAVDIFRDMSLNYQYVCVKLFTWQRKWYNLFKFCDRIHLNIGDPDVCEMYIFFKEKGIVDTEFIKDDVRKLLELMDPNDLKNIRDTFKLKKTLTTKQDIINSLLRCCSTQSTLTPKKSTLNILMGEIEQKLGYSVRLNESFYEAFYRTYILATFANRTFSKMSDYFKNVLHLRIAFPDYPIENYTVWYSKDEFVRYAKARKYRDGLEEILGKNHVESLQICKLIFDELKKTKNDENDYEGRYRDTPHLIQFTARAVYVSALSSAMSTLATKFPMDVKDWLEYMIREVNFPHRIGDWFYHLSWLYMNYLEPRNYTHAAKLIIEVLLEKREHLSEVQLHQLGKRGRALKVAKKYKIDQLYHDTIAELVPEPIDINRFPTTTVDASTVRSNELGRKRDYIVQDKEGNKTVLSVEYIALKHYLENGYTDGKHCEGSLIMATFTLFFWDIIYNSKEIIPGTFVSKVQSVPLDMNSKYFYLNRKNAIDKRLEEIETTWSRCELVRFVKDKYEKYSHLVALCLVDAFIEDVELLEVLIDCVGRVVLAKIYKRFVKNIRHYRSGLPDLLIWNVHEKKSKFVEVKGENDKLSLGQTLWLNYLQSIGADIEVCMVHSIGSRRKKIHKSEDAVSTEPATSSSSCIEESKATGPATSLSSIEESKGMKKIQVAQVALVEERGTSTSGGPKRKKRIKKTKEDMSNESTTSSSSIVESKRKKRVLKMRTKQLVEAITAPSSGDSKHKNCIQKGTEEMSEESTTSVPSIVEPRVKRKTLKVGAKRSVEINTASSSGGSKRKKKMKEELSEESTAPLSSSDEFE